MAKKVIKRTLKKNIAVQIKPECCDEEMFVVQFVGHGEKQGFYWYCSSCENSFKVRKVADYRPGLGKNV